jgi:hypothetical protein
MPFHYSSDFRPQICERMQTSEFRSFARRSSASAHMAIRGFNYAWRQPSPLRCSHLLSVREQYGQFSR